MRCRLVLIDVYIESRGSQPEKNVRVEALFYAKICRGGTKVSAKVTCDKK